MPTRIGKGRFGSRTEIPGSLETSGYVRIAALRLTSQVCHSETFQAWIPLHAVSINGLRREFRV